MWKIVRKGPKRKGPEVQASVRTRAGFGGTASHLRGRKSRLREVLSRTIAQESPGARIVLLVRGANRTACAIAYPKIPERRRGLMRLVFRDSETCVDQRFSEVAILPSEWLPRTAARSTA